MPKPQRARIQRMGMKPGAIIALDTEDLSFVDSDDEWLMIEKERTDDGLIIEIKVVIP